MARIRTIKPEFWSSEQIVECSHGARLLFIGIWNFADDNGVIPAKPKTIKMQVFPGDDETSESVQRMLDELSSNGLLVSYEVDGERYFRVTGWSKHQKIDRPSSKYPLPDAEPEAITRRALVERHPPEGKGRERKGKDSDANASAVEGVDQGDEATLFREGKALLGAKAGGFIAKLRRSVKGGDAEALRLVRIAEGKDDPREWLGAIIAGTEPRPPSMDEICPPEIYGTLQ